ncbi:MAG: hypothetical protein ACREKQ_09195 [Candidatus Rokuibacteriota bacterium]
MLDPAPAAGQDRLAEDQMRLDGKVALVSGAGSGIGRATAPGYVTGAAPVADGGGLIAQTGMPSRIPRP